MSTIIKGKNIIFSFKKREIDAELKAKLLYAYGDKITDKKMIACEDFLNAIGYKQSGSVYSKIKMLMMPILSDGSVTFDAFYDFVSNTKLQVGGRTIIDSQWNVKYLTESGEYMLNDYYNFNERGCCCKGISADSGKLQGAWNCFGEYNVYTPKVAEYSPFYLINTKDGGLSTTIYTGGGNNKLNGIIYKGKSSPYISKSIATDLTTNEHTFVLTGYGNSTQEYYINDGNEVSMAGSSEVTIDSSLTLDGVGFGASATNVKYTNGCVGDIKYQIMGYGEQLTLAEARILSNALNSFKEQLNLESL